MNGEFIVLRLVHILGGIFWVGTALFTTLFLVPALTKSGPAAGQVMAALQGRRLFTVLPVIALLTILSGVRLMWLTSTGFDPAYFALPSGGTFSMSGGAAILAFILSLVVVRPAAVRSVSIGASLATATDETTRTRLTAELAGLRRRGAIVSTVVLVLLVLGAAGMSVARYLQ